jgi:hypothetical protein
VLHLAAHAAFGAIHLSLDGDPVALLPDDAHAAIRAATWRQALAVLNYCDSDRLARSLAVHTGGPAPAAAAIGWRGTVDEGPGTRPRQSVIPQTGRCGLSRCLVRRRVPHRHRDLAGPGASPTARQRCHPPVPEVS